MSEIIKTEKIIKDEVIKKFEKIGVILEEGVDRGFKREEIIQLIIGKVIEL